MEEENLGGQENDGHINWDVEVILCEDSYYRLSYRRRLVCY
jgi:hypothetical protein